MPTMTINFLEFASGGAKQQLSFLPLVTIPFIPDAGLGSVTAPARVLNPSEDPNFPIPWVFGFWNINGSVSLTPTAALPEPVHDFTASAWYFEDPGAARYFEEVDAVVFSLKQNSVLTGDDAIASVTPASAQEGPNRAVTFAGPVTIEAVDRISGEGNFVSWLPHSHGGVATVTGKALTAQQSSAVLAIAFYR